MIISHVIGGLGNQMFQYAAGRALALKTNQPLKLDISDFSTYNWHLYELDDVFDLPQSPASKLDCFKVLGWQSYKFTKNLMMGKKLSFLRKKEFVIEPSFNYWKGFAELSGKRYLLGFWQTERYFAEFEDQIRQDFTFKSPLSEKNSQLVKEINESNSVSIHLRRGNYVSDPSTSVVHGTCDLDYYRQGAKMIAEKIANPVFYIFSDDPEWVKENLKVDFPSVYVNHNSGKEGYNDMRLMSHCKHNIIANSTFSWWGAWLNLNKEKMVIAPKKWFAKETFQQNVQDLYPEGWIKI